MIKVDILFDMDDVMTLLTKSVVAVWNEQHPQTTMTEWTRVGQPWWVDCKNPDNLSEQELKDSFMHIIHKRKGLFENLDPDTEYLNVFNSLIDGQRILKSANAPIGHIGVVTRPVWDSQYCMSEKVNWLKQHSPNFDIEYNLHMTASKSRLATPHTILIDDNITNITKWKEKGGIGILVARKSNECISSTDQEKCDVKVSNGEELIDAIWKVINDINKPNNNNIWLSGQRHFNPNNPNDVTPLPNIINTYPYPYDGIGISPSILECDSNNQKAYTRRIVGNEDNGLTQIPKSRTIIPNRQNG